MLAAARRSAAVGLLAVGSLPFPIPTPIFFGLQRRIPDDISKKPSPPQLAVSASLEGHAGHSKVRSRPYVHKHITFVSEAYEARVKKCVKIGD